MRIDTLDESCVAMHEWFLSLVRAGFTEDHALRFIAYMTAVSGKRQDDDG